MEATLLGSWLYFSATMKFKTAGGSMAKIISKALFNSFRVSHGMIKITAIRPESGLKIAPINPIFQSLRSISTSLTPNENSISGMAISPIMLKGVRRVAGIVTVVKLSATPNILTNTMGMRSTLINEEFLSMVLMPTLKCNVFSTINKIMAAGMADFPKASSVKGRPIFPEFAYIMGGTNVLILSPMNLANIQANKPDIKTTPIAPMASI